jgi:putative sporulation protein YtxC
MHITFEKASDLDYVYQLFSTTTGLSCHDMEVFIEENQTLYIKMTNKEDYAIHTYIAPALTAFILKVKEPEFIRHFLATIFFYDDETEQQQIIQMVDSLVSEDEVHTHPQLRDGYRREEMLHQALTMFLSRHIYFSFEAFLKFRLKEYYSRLLDYIEVAIDEYKLEQDYQDFIESLRKYIASKNRSSINLVHVVYEDGRFLFYDENLDPFTYNVQNLDDEFISIQGFEVDKELIAPLLLICPNHINLYLVDGDQGIVQTLVNIFQERVKILPYDWFTKQQH